MSGTIAGRRLSVIGLGYVGLPVAVAFGRLGRVVGYDIDAERIDELRRGMDRTREVGAGDLEAADIFFTTDPADLAQCDFHIVTVPTPVHADRTPDLGPLERASRTLGAKLAPGHIVVYESTVYPGATEEFCTPLLERVSGLSRGRDFEVGYSPERINPGDRTHRFETIPKVVAASSPAAADTVAAVYGAAVPAGVYRAPSIRVAEAAKVIENTQRDLNIALMNELAMLFDRMGIDTADVVRTASTKWNFQPFMPGLVGGHCIGVDPYYLTHKATLLGYTPRIILAGRDINDGMPRFVAERTMAALRARGVDPARSRVSVLGFTFKENIPDTRNTAVAPLRDALLAAGASVQVHDPLADHRQTLAHYGVEITQLGDMQKGQAVVLAVAHDCYREAGWPMVLDLLADAKGVVFDVKGVLDRAAVPAGVQLERL